MICEKIFISAQYPVEVLDEIVKCVGNRKDLDGKDINAWKLKPELPGSRACDKSIRMFIPAKDRKTAIIVHAYDYEKMTEDEQRESYPFLKMKFIEVMAHYEGDNEHADDYSGAYELWTTLRRFDTFMKLHFPKYYTYVTYKYKQKTQ